MLHRQFRWVAAALPGQLEMYPKMARGPGWGISGMMQTGSGKAETGMQSQTVPTPISANVQPAARYAG